MLELRKRHQEGCALFTPARPFSKNLECKRCVYVAYGSVDGKKIRESLDTTNREEAHDRLSERWKQARTGTPPPVNAMSAREAVEAYLGELRSSGRTPKTIARYAASCNRLSAFLDGKAITDLKKVTSADMSAFKGTWGNELQSDTSRQKEQQRLKTFFRWCGNQTPPLILSDPTKGLMRISVANGNVRERFTDEEIDRIFASIDSVYPANAKGTNGSVYQTRPFVRAFLLVLRYTALRISDVTNLQRHHLDGDRLFLHTLKTGQPVYTVVPSVVSDALREIDRNGEFYFYPGNPGTFDTWRKKWSDILKPVYRKAKVRYTSHAWRDTLVFKLLRKKVRIELISRLLGHDSIQITWDHYSAWVPELQEELEMAVREHIHSC
ncbi:MAG: site-specific integrase [Acidobacteria bacterium]|nr:site-specific integrase [Acidobacteriota bacterium]